MPPPSARDRPPGARAGQVALVTGGSAGLGEAIAGALALAGSTVVLASRSAERCAAAAERLAGATGQAVTGHGATSPTSMLSMPSWTGCWPSTAGWMSW